MKSYLDIKEPENTCNNYGKKEGRKLEGYVFENGEAVKVSHTAAWFVEYHKLHYDNHLRTNDIASRLNTGWSEEQATTMPLGKSKGQFDAFIKSQAARVTKKQAADMFNSMRLV